MRTLIPVVDGVAVEIRTATLRAPRLRRVAVGPDGAELRPVEIVDGEILPTGSTTAADVDDDGRIVDSGGLRPVEADGSPATVAASTIGRPVEARPIGPLELLRIRSRSVLSADLAPPAPVAMSYSYQDGTGRGHTAAWTATEDGAGVVIVGDPVELEWLAPGEIRDWSEAEIADGDPWGDP